ncbi:MAG TPA: right-handed parallel beta-helix repeat-containing protein, partial [Bacteroidales bacterium]|nr:right-handed parallel beta-helix repeat-containing protein [Bacteroidales bacterium]
MKARITITSLLVVFIVLTYGQTTIPGGDVYGTWTISGSPYLVQGDINVPADCTLVIEPGVVIDFQGNYMTQVFGNLLAQGTETDTIRFISTSSIGHRGLKYLDVPEETDSSIFTYCRFQDANCTGTWPFNCGGGMGIMDFDKVRIEHCLFIDNQAWNGAQAAGGAIAFGGFDGIIRYNSFIDNKSPYGGAIICWENSNPTIAGNYFFNNFATYEGGAIIIWAQCDPVVNNNVFIANRANQFGGAISVFDNCNPVIKYNLFSDNLALQDGGAIEVNKSCAPLIQNNTMAFNQANQHGGAIDIYDESCPSLVNNIMWGNQSPNGTQVFNWSPECIPDFFNNDIQYGYDSIGG